MANDENHSAPSQEGEHIAQATAGPGADRGTTMSEPVNTDAVPVQHGGDTAHNPNVTSSQSSSSTANAIPTEVSNKEQASVNPEETRTKLQTSVIMASLMASVFLAALDITIVTTAYVFELQRHSRLC